MGEEPTKIEKNVLVLVPPLDALTERDKQLELRLDAWHAHDQVQKAQETRKRAHGLYEAANDQVQKTKEVYNKLKKRYAERYGDNRGCSYGSGLPDVEDDSH